MESDVIDLILRASDEGGLYSETIIKVTVLDVNDNTPQFVQRHNSLVRVLENVAPGQEITRLAVSDPDLGPNGDIVYQIRSGSFGKFLIDPERGSCNLNLR